MGITLVPNVFMPEEVGYMLNARKETSMAGGSKPAPRTRRAEKFQDGAKKGGGIGKKKHAGPGRGSKTIPKGTKGSQIQRRQQP
jgi:hypothetical protein